MHQRSASQSNKSSISRNRKLLASIVAVPLVSGLMLSKARAADVYWDSNADTPGAGATPTGTWGTDAFWTTDPTGSTTPTAAWTPGDNAFFSAGTDATGAWTLNITGTQSAGAVLFAEGNVTIASGTIDTAAGAVTIGTGAGSTARVNTASSLRFNSAGKVVLDGGTLFSTTVTTASSILNAAKGLEVTANGGTVGYDDGSAINAFTTIYAGTITGAGGTTSAGVGTLTKIGPDEFRVQGANVPNFTFQKLVVNQGLYRIGASGTPAGAETGFGAAPASEDLSAITLNNGASIGQSLNLTLHVNRGITLGTGGGGLNTSAGQLTVPGKISGPGALLKTTTGTLILSGDNSYAGGTTYTNGRIDFNHSNAAGTGDITVTPAGAISFRYSGGGTVTLNNNVILNSGASTIDFASPSGTMNLNGVISGNANFTRGATASAGSLVFGGTSPNTFTGNVTISSAILTAAKNDALGTTGGTTTVNLGATLGFSGDINYSTPEPVTISGVGNGSVGAISNRSGVNTFAGPVTMAADSSIGAASGSLTLSGVISGAFSLTKVGAGTLALTASNTYSGDSTISAGTLSVNSQANLGTSTNAIQLGNGTLQTAAPVTFTRNLSVNHAASTFDSNTHDSSIGNVAGTGGLTKTSAGKLTASQVKVAGAVAVNGGTLEIATNGGPSGMLESTALTVADGALLAMNDNDFIVNYGESDPSPEFALRDKVKAIYLGGTSGISYTAGAGDVALAVAERTEWGFSEFNGVALDTTTVIGKYTYFGDANLDGKVTSDDYVAVDVGLGTGDSWVQGDFNFSGTVTSDDYVAIDVNLGKGSPTPLAFAELKAEMVAIHTAMFGDEYVQKLAEVEAEGFIALVPEPGAVSVLGIGLMGLLGRRRRGC